MMLESDADRTIFNRVCYVYVKNQFLTFVEEFKCVNELNYESVRVENDFVKSWERKNFLWRKIVVVYLCYTMQFRFHI